jgi:hypothetical protein
MNKIKNILKDSIKRSVRNQREYRLFDTNVFVKDPLPDNINLKEIFFNIEKRIPSYFLFYVDVIYIGEFNELFSFEAGNVNALYENGAIYITNHQDDAGDFIDDFIHELAHALEDQFNTEIYSDMQIEKEFIEKRVAMERILRYNGYETSNLDFEESEYNPDFDAFLNFEIGYATLHSLLNGLFVSPYAATSLREYFADAFEEYYLRDRKYLFNISPRAFEKINNLNKLGDYR